jgi:hypothetical protein
MSVATRLKGSVIRQQREAMASIEDINKLLRSCAAELDRCAGLIRDAGLDPVKQNIHRIGHALFNISEIQNEIFKLKPELMPKEWNEPITDKELNRAFGELLIESGDLCESGKPLSAIERLEAFIGIHPGKNFSEMAKNEIASIKLRYGV